MALKTRMIKELKDSLKNKLTRNRRCEYCDCEFPSNAEYLFHISCHPNQIIPNLFLANKSSVYDSKFLQRIGITHLLYINNRRYTSYQYDVRLKKTTSYSLLETYANHVKTIEIASDQNITKHFNESFVFIDSALLKHNERQFKILIFCEFGIALSAAFIIAYLMSRYHLSLSTAHNLLTEERNIKNTSKYLKQLQLYENEYCYHAVTNNHHKKLNKINVLSSNNHMKRQSSMDSKDEKEAAVICKRTITMKSSVYEEKLLQNDENDENRKGLFKRNKRKSRIQRSHSTGFLALNSHIVFTNI